MVALEVNLKHPLAPCTCFMVNPTYLTEQAPTPLSTYSPSDFGQHIPPTLAPMQEVDLHVSETTSIHPIRGI
jgi:hypothetical protein